MVVAGSLVFFGDRPEVPVFYADRSQGSGRRTDGFLTTYQREALGERKSKDVG